MAHKKMIRKNSIHMATPDTRDFIKPWFKFFSFKDGETKYYISAINYDGKTKAIDQFKDKEVFIYDRLYPEPQKRFFTVINIISDLSWHTNKITLVVPYFPFLRQDHDSVNTDPFKEHEGKTAWVSLRLLAQAGLSYLITLDGHSFKRPGVFTTYEKFRNFPIGKDGKEIPEFGIIPPTLKIVNLTMAPELKRKVNFLAKKQGYDEVLFISPDLGASYMTEINLRKTRGGAVINKLLDSNVKNAHQIFNELVEVIFAFNVKIIVKDNFSVVAVQNTDSRLELLAMVKRIADDEDVNIKIVQNDKFTLVKIKDDTTEKRKQFWTSMYEFAKEYQLQHIPLDIAIVNGADPLYETDMDKELKRLYDLIF